MRHLLYKLGAWLLRTRYVSEADPVAKDLKREIDELHKECASLKNKLSMAVNGPR